MRIKLGEKVKDTLTEFEGTVIARTEYLFSVSRLGVQGEILKEGRPDEPQWFDESRMKVIVKLQKIEKPRKIEEKNPEPFLKCGY